MGCIVVFFPSHMIHYLFWKCSLLSFKVDSWVLAHGFETHWSKWYKTLSVTENEFRVEVLRGGRKPGTVKPEGTLLALSRTRDPCALCLQVCYDLYISLGAEYLCSIQQKCQGIYIVFVL